MRLMISLLFFISASVIIMRKSLSFFFTKKYAPGHGVKARILRSISSGVSLLKLISPSSFLIFWQYTQFDDIY